jgi:ATP-dependent helicase/DNAse subunit B
MLQTDITLLIGPACSGKTHTVLRLLGEQQAGRALLLLPGGLQQQAIRGQAPRRVHVTHFYGIARLVLEQAGQNVPPLVNTTTRTMLLRSLVRQMHAESKLPTIGSVAQKPGFIATLAALIDEAQDAGIMPGKLAAARMLPYDGELDALYAAYRAMLRSLGQSDMACYLEMARDALQDMPPGTGLQGFTMLVVDGFDQFTPLQLDLLAELTRHVPRAIITLTGEPDERPAHRRFIRTRQQLVARLNPTIQKLERSESAQAAAPALAHIEAHLFNLTMPEPHANDRAVHLIKAADHEREVRAVLRRVRHLLHEGAAPEQVALLLRSGTNYVPLLREVAAEYELPLAQHYGLPLAEAPPVVALLLLLRLPLESYPWRAVCEVWRSFGDGRLAPYAVAMPLPMPDPPLSPEHAASLLERAARGAGITEGLPRLRATLRALAEAVPEDEPNEDGMQGRTIGPDEAAAVLAFLETLVAWLTPPEQATIAEYATWVQERTIAMRDLPQQAGDTLRARVFVRWSQALDDLADAANLLDEPSVNFAQFMNDLANTARSARYYSPDQSDGIAVLPVLAARGLLFEHVLLLGMSDGEFPLKLGDPPFYTRRERSILAQRGVPLVPPDPADERSLFYETVARARRSLTLSYTYLDEQGNPIPVSPYVKALCSLLSLDETTDETHKTAGSVPALEEAVSPQEQLVALIQQPETADIAPAAQQLLPHVRRACNIEKTRESDEDYGPYDGILQDADVLAEIAKQFGPAHAWSVTQFNTYITCPFRFAAAHILKLQTPGEPEEGLASAGRGLVYHAILAKAGRNWRKTRKPLTKEHEDEFLQMVQQAADEVLAAVEERPDFVQGAFWDWEQADVRRRLDRSLRKLLKDDNKAWDAFTIASVEESFGPRPHDHYPPLKITTPAGDILVQGRIDRIDQRDDTGALALIDYKSSSTPRSLTETTSGRDVQLAIYLLAVEQVIAQATGQRVERAAFLHLGSGKLSKPLTDAEREEALNAMQQHVEEVVQGVRDGNFAVHPRDKCAPNCAFSGICRLHLPRRDTNRASGQHGSEASQ